MPVPRARELEAHVEHVGDAVGGVEAERRPEIVVTRRDGNPRLRRPGAIRVRRPAPGPGKSARAQKTTATSTGPEPGPVRRASLHELLPNALEARRLQTLPESLSDRRRSPCVLADPRRSGAPRAASSAVDRRSCARTKKRYRNRLRSLTIGAGAGPTTCTEGSAARTATRASRSDSVRASASSRASKRTSASRENGGFGARGGARAPLE